MSKRLLSFSGACASDNWGDLSNHLSTRIEERVPATSFKMLDCFDQSLRASKALLLEVGEELILVDANGAMWRQPAARSGNFVADLCDGPVKARLTHMSPLRCLLEMGQGQIDCTMLQFADDSENTHLRIGWLVLSAGETTVTLLTVNAMRGYKKSAKHLHKTLQNRGAVPADLAEVTDALFPDLDHYVAKPKLSFAPSTTAFDAANQIVRAYLAVARQNEPGVIADFDTEFLHEYRIAMRKIRSVLSLFKGVYEDAVTAELKQRFSGLMASTGPLRDLDVYLLERELYFDMLPDKLHEGLRLMFEAFEADRSAALTSLTNRLQSVEYKRDMAELQCMFDTPDALLQGEHGDESVADYAKRLIWKRYKKVCKTAREIDDATPDAQVHELRISCKKLRYLIEFFKPEFDAADIKVILKPLKRMQENLGLFNDYSVQQESLQTFVERGRLNGQPALKAAQSVGALIVILHMRQLEERARVVQNFARFDSSQTRQCFRRLFS
ncbi:CHAD domain-containing protein [Epibacterium sp. SM1969]|uniref:CHAD domain-containing protein n=1 Tax=Tritonibacter aquimaris TaxID=2663379 RepID=A0A844ATS3_9RHOB|nr:CHAD domain-containing protein [Tritonibacter aquimaris]MQY43197.1 CHAD domain-containing protein [Tritonibacter aquimaris]